MTRITFMLGLAVLACSVGCETPSAAMDGGAPPDAAAPDASGRADAGLARGLYPLGAPAEDFEAGDLDVLADLLGDAEVIGIGESVHTTGGELQMRARVIRWLVTHHDVREITVEMARGIIAERTAPYVDACTGTAEDASLGFNPIWWDRSTPALLAWLCEWNTANPSERVRIRGTDIRQPWVDLPYLRDFFTRLASAESTRVDGLDSCLGAGFASEEAFFMDAAVLSYFGEGTPAQLPQTGHDTCVAGSQAVRAFLTDNRAELVSRSSELEVERARLAALSMEAFDTSIYFLSRGDLESANPLRDAAMADIFLTERRFDPPGGRTVLFAHNGHTMRRSDEALGGQWRDVPNLSTLIDAELDYVVIGQASMITHIDWTRGPQTITNDGSDYLERLLDDQGQPFLLVDVPAATGLLGVDQPYRVGFDSMVPAWHYDVLLFHHESLANDYFRPSPWGR